jgi:hypothetical protein
LNQARVPPPGIIVAETEDCIRFRVEQAGDIDIYKSKILGWNRIAARGFWSIDELAFNAGAGT